MQTHKFRVVEGIFIPISKQELDELDREYQYATRRVRILRQQFPDLEDIELVRMAINELRPVALPGKFDD